MKVTIANAFSLSMLPGECEPHFRPLGDIREALKPFDPDETLEVNSWVGHADTAALLSELAGVEIPCNRVNGKLGYGEKLFVAQYSGSRLPEGATMLPEGATINWWLVELGWKHCPNFTLEMIRQREHYVMNQLQFENHTGEPIPTEGWQPYECGHYIWHGPRDPETDECVMWSLEFDEEDPEEEDPMEYVPVMKATRYIEKARPFWRKPS